MAMRVGYEHILYEEAGPLALVTMNRPQQRNALSLAHLQELTACFRVIGARRDLQVAILRGRGPAFCAGHDLAELLGRDATFYRRVFAACTELMRTLQAIPQPVIAQVHGPAVAAGCQLVATCDLAVASAAATFGTPGVRIGLFCSTPMVAVSRSLPRKKALELLLTGEPLSADDALRYGLVNRVVSPERLEAETRALAERVAAASPAVVALGKQAFYRQLELSQDQAYAYTQEVMALNALAADAQEGIGAFLAKRPPHWRGWAEEASPAS
jgi:enoyl-CoA hydratase/carnithine racemase